MSAGRKRRRGRSLVRRMAYWSLVLGLWAFIAVGGVLLWVAAHLPPIQSLEIPKRPPSIQIVGNDGSLLAGRGEMHGNTLTLKDMPPYLPKAFLAIEDRRFYSHFGIDPIGLARAMYANLSRRGVSQGGSTITQQLAKNLFLTQERTMGRKLQEVVLALWLEHKFSKTEILELYLNRVYFGSGAYGVDAAALRYFAKSARQVTLAEAAMLAGLIRSPSRLAPNRNPEGAERRAQVVIAAMTERGDITETMAKHAAGAARPRGADRRHRLRQLRRRLDHGRARRSRRPHRSGSGGAHLDRPGAAGGRREGADRGTRAARRQTRRRPGRDRCDDADWRSARAGGRRATMRKASSTARSTARRQPGSAFKPFVYLTALERGLGARQRARGQADRAQGLAAGELYPRVLWTGDADAGARAFAQHRVGAPDAGGRSRPRSPRPPTGSALLPSSIPIHRSRSAPRRSR